MRKSEQLYYLVKSLTKSEKRSFKLFAKINSNGEKNNYTILFDELDKMQQYDHQLLVKNLSRKTNTKNVSQLKKQLNEVIMRSLLQYSSVNTKGMQIHSNINYITILLLKGLTAQASDLIAKTKEMAINHEDFIAMDRLSLFEQLIAMSNTDKAQIDAYLNHDLPQVEAAREVARLEGDLDLLILRIRSFSLEHNGRVTGEELEQLDAIVDVPILKKPPNNLSVDGVISLHAIWGYYYYLKGDGTQTYYHRKRVMDLMDSVGTYPPVLWIFHARILLIGLSYFGMRDLFNIELIRIRKALEEIPDDRKGAFAHYLLELTLKNIELDAKLHEKRFSEAMELLPEIETITVKAEAFMDSNLRMTLLSNFTTAQIAVGAYKEALKNLNTVMNSSEMNAIRINTQCYNRVKNIAIHYSLGNYSLIDSLTASTLRFFKKNHRLNPYVESFLKFARKHMRDAYTADKKSIFFDEIAQLHAILEKEGEKIRSLEYFNIGLWLTAVAHQTTMEEIVRKNV